MDRLRSTVFLAVFCGLMAPGGPRRSAAEPWLASMVGSIVNLTEPMVRQVVQRRDDNVGNIVFVGTYSGNVDGFQARSILRPGMVGQAIDWSAVIDVTIWQDNFIGIFRQPAGGFYDLQIRPVYQGQVGQPVVVYAVGVGEVFITAGQSNTTNFGSPTGFAPDLRVSCFVDGSGRGLDPSYPGASWRWGVDPQASIDQSTGGSVWPTMANNLAIVLNVPIGLYSAGCGGTSIAEWLPGYLKPPTLVTPQMVLFNRLTNAINYFKYRGGVRAVLWQQGESDYDLKTNPSVYQANLYFIINQSRSVTGVPIKWMVAQASSPLTSNLPLRIGLEQAQAAVVDKMVTFSGPCADLIGLPFRLFVDGEPQHFNAPGLVMMGSFWGIYVANLPGFLWAGYLPPE